MKQGDQIEYARHQVAWQEDGSHVSIGEEDWAPATVLNVAEAPIPIHTPDAKPNIIVRLQPADGSPPFDLNAKLVRETIYE